MQGYQLQGASLQGVNIQGARTQGANAILVPADGGIGRGTISSQGPLITGVGTLFVTDSEIAGLIETSFQTGLVVTTVDSETQLTMTTTPSPVMPLGTNYAYADAP